MPVFVASHPLIDHKMTRLRNESTNSHDFRQILKEITFYLGFEATRHVKTSESVITTPMGVEFKGSRIGENIAIIPILRAGNVMGDGMLELLPNSAVHHIGMYRQKESLLPIQYYNRLPRGSSADTAYIVDPCIASSNTIQAVVSIVKKWGAKKIVVVAAIGSRFGVEKLSAAHPDIDIHVAAIDEELSDRGYIVPGIGDAGDRMYGTPVDHDIAAAAASDAVAMSSPAQKRKHVADDK